MIKASAWNHLFSTHEAMVHFSIHMENNGPIKVLLVFTIVYQGPECAKEAVCGCCIWCGGSAGPGESPGPPASPDKDAGLRGWSQADGQVDYCRPPPSAGPGYGQAAPPRPPPGHGHSRNLQG